MVIKLLVMSLICFLWWKGGDKDGKIRDIPIPIILALYLAIYLKTWWLLLLAGPCQIIRLGYGNYDPEHDNKPSLLARLLKDRQGKYIRLIWGLIVALNIGLFLAIFKFINWKFYLGYIIINSLINFSVCQLRLNRLITDILVSLGIGSIMLLV